jgi:DNA-binding NarL/FixJ family response regulator
LIVEDHPLFLEGFQAMVGRLRPDWSPEAAASAVGAMASIAHRPPDAVLLDVFLPDSDGFDLLEALHGRWPDLPVVLMSGRDHAAMAMRARKSPARGFIPKSTAGPEFVAAIEAAVAGRRAFAAAAAPSAHRPALTPRQAQILALLAAGHGNKEIRHRLGIAERTVRAHLTELFQLLGVHGRMLAVIRARELGLIE